MVHDYSSKIYIQNVVTDNSNTDYPNTIKLIYWRLIVSCTHDTIVYSTEREYITEFLPQYGNNFIELEFVDESIMSNWIIQKIGTSLFDNLINLQIEVLHNQLQAPEPSDVITYYFYDTNLNKWQLQQ